MKKEYTDKELELRRKISLILYALTVILAIVMLILILTQGIDILFLTLVLTFLVISFAIATKLKLHILPYLANNLIKKSNSNFPFLTYSQSTGIPEKYFREANFIKKYTDYSSIDFVFGKTKEKEIIISDIVVKKRIDTSKKTETAILYKGIFGITDFVTENNIEMIIAPDIKNKFLNNISEDVKKALGANRKIVRLENPEFERFFEVYCDDQVSARKIITLAFMEKMVRFRELIKQDITLIYKNNKIYFFIDKRLIVDSNKLYFKGVTEEIIKETTELIDLLCRLGDAH